MDARSTISTSMTNRTAVRRSYGGSANPTEVQRQEEYNTYIGEIHIIERKPPKAENKVAYAFLATCDTDFPMAWLSTAAESKKCPECGGWIYPSPRFAPEDICAVIKELGGETGGLDFRHGKYCDTVAQAKRNAATTDSSAGSRAAMGLKTD